MKKMKVYVFLAGSEKAKIFYALTEKGHQVSPNVNDDKFEVIFVDDITEHKPFMKAYRNYCFRRYLQIGKAVNDI